MWQCTKCGEEVGHDMDVCWNCGTSQDGVEDPKFRRDDFEPPPPQTEREWTYHYTLRSLVLLMSICCVVLGVLHSIQYRMEVLRMIFWLALYALPAAFLLFIFLIAPSKR